MIATHYFEANIVNYFPYVCIFIALLNTLPIVLILIIYPLFLYFSLCWALL